MPSILLVEPDPLLAKQYRTLLEQSVKQAVQVVRVARAQTAVSRLDESQFDVIILELLLGRHNGIELLYEIKSYSDLRNIPIIIHSSIEPALLQGSIAYPHFGIYRYVKKPVRDPNTLLYAVQSCIDEHSSKSILNL